MTTVRRQVTRPRVRCHMGLSRREFLASVNLMALPLAPRRQLPNILVILVDDLGWSDLRCYGDRFFETPHLDRLAQEGMRFTNAYAAAPICSASRASILTGRSPARLHFEFVSQHKDTKRQPPNTQLLQPAYTDDLPLGEVTISETLRVADYATGFVGKWHLTQQADHYLGHGSTHGPKQQGFDYASENFGSHPYSYKTRDFSGCPERQFPTDQTTADAIRFLEQNRQHSLLLVYSSYYPHEPVHTRCRWLYEKYAGTPEANGAAADRAMYGAFVEMMDHYIGQLLAAVDRLKLRDNTLVVFTSDNGAHPAYLARNILRGSKWTLYEGGIRVPLIARWPGVIRPGFTCDVPVIGTDLAPTFVRISGASESAYTLDGTDLTPLFMHPAGSGWKPRELVWHFPYYHSPYVLTRPESAIRDGAWKLIYRWEDGSVELYDLVKDIGEHINRSPEQPEVVNRLRGKLLRFLKAVGARIPRPNPEYRVAGESAP